VDGRAALNETVLTTRGTYSDISRTRSLRKDSCVTTGRLRQSVVSHSSNARMAKTKATKASFAASIIFHNTTWR